MRERYAAQSAIASSRRGALSARCRRLTNLVILGLVPLGCDSGTGLEENPPPVVTALAPDSVASGSPTTLLTVTGSGFVPTSTVQVNGVDRPTTYQSSTTLTTSLQVGELAAPGSLSVRVFSAAPGGGTSAALPLTVFAATPVIGELQPSSITAGRPNLTLAVAGLGFRPGAVVSWDGVDRPTTRESATRLTIVLGEADLAVAGEHTVKVHHVLSPLDSSQGLPFTVKNPHPLILSVTPPFASAGHAALTLTVEGAAFVPGAVLRWNDAPRPTTFVSANRLTVAIPATDVASAGSATLRVWNPEPSEAPSNAVTFSVDPPGRHNLGFDVGDLAWDPVRGRLYASIRSTDATYPNRVIALDPMTGEVIQTVFVGSDPVRLAMSDDASVLYVALDGAASIRRVDLSTFTAGLQFPVGVYRINDLILYANDMEVMPGHPGTIAITLMVHGYNGEGPIAEVMFYDDGVPRLLSTGGGTVIEFAGPDTLYGYNNSSSGFNVFRMLVTDSGAVVDSAAGGLMWGFFTDFRYQDGLMFGTDGSVVDGRQMSVRGTVTVGGTVALDSATGRAFYMWQNTLTAIDAATLSVIGSETIAGMPALDQPGWFSPLLVRWGTDGFAYRTFDRLVVFRSNLALP
jgi:trimeric autotransporter adhesin